MSLTYLYLQKINIFVEHNERPVGILGACVCTVYFHCSGPLGCFGLK